MNQGESSSLSSTKVNSTKIGEKNGIKLALFKQLKVHKINGKKAFEVNNSPQVFWSVWWGVSYYLWNKRIWKMNSLWGIWKTLSRKLIATYQASTPRRQNPHDLNPQEEKELAEVFEFLKVMECAAAEIRYANTSWNKIPGNPPWKRRSIWQKM